VTQDGVQDGVLVSPAWSLDESGVLVHAVSQFCMLHVQLSAVHTYLCIEDCCPQDVNWMIEIDEDG